MARCTIFISIGIILSLVFFTFRLLLLLFLDLEPRQSSCSSELSTSLTSRNSRLPSYRTFPANLQLDPRVLILTQRNTILAKLLLNPPLLLLLPRQSLSSPLPLPPSSTPVRAPTKTLHLSPLTHIHQISLMPPQTLHLPPGTPKPLPRVPISPQPLHVRRKAIPLNPKRPPVIHLHIMRQLMHHHHLDLPEGHPAPIPPLKH